MAPGLAPPVQPDANQAEGGGFKRTMLGVAPPSVIQQRLGNQAPQQPRASTEPTLGKAAEAAAAPAKPNLAGTQVQFTPGTAPLGGFNPSGTLALDGNPPQAAPSPSAPPAPVAPPGTGSNQRTVLGVAVPGIAPIHAGQPKPAEPITSAPPPPAAYEAPSLSQAEAQPEPERPRRLLYALFVAAFFGLALLSVLAFYLLSSPYAVEAKVVLDDSGNEQLEVSCSDCPDGTTSEIDGEMTTFKAGKATVTLKDPLKVGNNALSVSLLRPGDKHAETLELTVPVQFRVRGDLSGLAEETPSLRVSIQAIPGTSVVLDGSPLKLDAGGAGEYKVNVVEDLSGEASEVVALKKKVPYTITPPEGKPEQGEVTMRASITPLTLDAPGPSIVIDRANFMLAGRTQKGGSVSVAGRAITVDPAGRFAQLMSVSSAGETTINVRGSVKDHAPRLVPVKIRRVESLADEAKRLKGVSRTAFGDFAGNIDKSKGQTVLIDARVFESRTDSHTTVILANVTSGCHQDSCLVRVIYGAKLSLKKDEAITVSASVAGSVDGPRSGTKIPELQADFVVKEAK